MNNHLLRHILPFMVLLAAGCSTHSATTSKPQGKTASKTELTQTRVAPQANTPTETANTSEQSQINSCRRALDSLKQINALRARKLNDEFNALVNSAAQYNSVRNRVGDTTRQAVDSMYQFKSVKLCADIDKELMDSLISRGEASLQ